MLENFMARRGVSGTVAPMIPSTISRRTALKQTFCFSAALLAGKTSLGAKPVLAQAPGSSHFTMIGDWGKDGENAMQKAVAKGMESYMNSAGFTPEAMFLLGDNFYGPFKGGTNCPRWKEQFSMVYPKSVFPGSCHAVLGNHDYDDEPVEKLKAELAYAKANPGTRWNMPAKWYRLDIAQAGNPLMTVLAVDSNYHNGRVSLTMEERAGQMVWLKSELAKPKTAPWLVVTGHHPLYSNGQHGDDPALIKDWDALFREHGVHFYFCGHDHDLQHLEFDGHPTSFVISGGGGASVRDLKEHERGPFSKAVHGFTHLEVTPERFHVRHVDENGQLLHGFAKTPDGAWRLLG